MLFCTEEKQHNYHTPKPKQNTVPRNMLKYLLRSIKITFLTVLCPFYSCLVCVVFLEQNTSLYWFWLMFPIFVKTIISAIMYSIKSSRTKMFGLIFPSHSNIKHINIFSSDCCCLIRIMNCTLRKKGIWSIMLGNLPPWSIIFPIAFVWVFLPLASFFQAVLSQVNSLLVYFSLLSLPLNSVLPLLLPLQSLLTFSHFWSPQYLD